MDAEVDSEMWADENSLLLTVTDLHFFFVHFVLFFHMSRNFTRYDSRVTESLSCLA